MPRISLTANATHTKAASPASTIVGRKGMKNAIVTTPNSGTVSTIYMNAIPISSANMSTGSITTVRRPDIAPKINAVRWRPLTSSDHSLAGLNPSILTRKPIVFEFATTSETVPPDIAKGIPATAIVTAVIPDEMHA